MNIYISESEKIYFTKTKEYFQEVISSYSNGNYRSAVVMLYSICICDLLYKLQELKDIYNDSTAINILQTIEATRTTADDKTKWENDLIEAIRKKTELLDMQSYTNLLHLKDYRNLSAHPALNNNYELIAPTKEITIAYIINAINDIFSRPPIFIKSVFGLLTDDLDQKKSYLLQDKTKLASFLENKYFSKMSLSMKTKIFKTLWKFCFCKKNDSKAIENIEINREALIILSNDLKSSIPELMQSFDEACVVSDHDDLKKSLILYLSVFPDLYKSLPSDTKDSMDSFICVYSSIRYICWFLSANIPSHLTSLLKKGLPTIPWEYKDYFEESVIEKGHLSDLIEFYIDYYGESPHFEDADSRFSQGIHPYLHRFSREQFIRIIKVSNENSQIYNRRRSVIANNEIIKVAKIKLPSDFDFTKYEHFEFESELLNSE